MWDFLFVIYLRFIACDFCLETVSLDTVCLLWVFQLAFLLPRPRHGFPRLLFCSHAQFPLPDISISFRGGLFCLLFTPYAHAMGFPACFSTSTPSFLSATYRLASGVGFSACFSSPTPTPWVSPLIFLLPHPVFSLRHIDQLPGWAFLLAFLLLRPCRGFFRLLFCSHAQINRFIKRNYEFSVIKSCIPFTKQHIYATLNTTRLSSLSASYFIQKTCFTIQIFTHPHKLHFTVLSDNFTCFRIKPAI